LAAARDLDHVGAGTRDLAAELGEQLDHAVDVVQRRHVLEGARTLLGNSDAARIGNAAFFAR